MKPCLVDVNIVLALLSRRHVHHERVSAWSEKLDPGQAGLCRLVQLGVVRLLGNRAIMGEDALPAIKGWWLLEELLKDQRFDFVPEPPNVDSFLADALQYSVNPSKLVTDAYFASFAIASSRRFVTLDRDFLRFQGLDVDLLPQ